MPKYKQILVMATMNSESDSVSQNAPPTTNMSIMDSNSHIASQFTYFYNELKVFTPHVKKMYIHSSV